MSNARVHWLHFVIMIKKICTKEILQKYPKFYDEFGEKLADEAVKGIHFIESEDAGVIVYVEKEHKYELMKFIERFMAAHCNISDPYQVLDIWVEEDAEREEIKRYIEASDERMVDEMFAELEKRLHDMEDKAAEEKRRAEEKKMHHEKIGFDYPVKYSPEMMVYIKELRRVTEALSEIDSMSQFFTKSLLVSMDDGWGYSAFLNVIRDELLPYFKVTAKDISIAETKKSISFIKLLP